MHPGFNYGLIFGFYVKICGCTITNYVQNPYQSHNRAGSTKTRVVWVISGVKSYMSSSLLQDVNAERVTQTSISDLLIWVQSSRTPKRQCFQFGPSAGSFDGCRRDHCERSYWTSQGVLELRMQFWVRKEKIRAYADLITSLPSVTIAMNAANAIGPMLFARDDTIGVIRAQTFTHVGVKFGVGDIEVEEQLHLGKEPCAGCY